MSIRPIPLLVAAFTALSLAPVGCSTDGLIGGGCGDGEQFCGGGCVDVATSEEHCGGCGETCDGTCEEGICSTSAGGSGGTGGSGAGVGGGAGASGLAGFGGAGTGAAGTGGSGTGGGATGGTGGASCAEPFNTPDECGDCDTQCSGETPDCGLVDGSYQCVPSCDTPPFTTLCNGVCVDISSDPNHCGACSVVCPSGICSDQDPVDGKGECQGKTNGHVIGLCMNFQSQSEPQTRILANSVFLTPIEPARILGYTQYTSNPVKSGMKDSLDAAATIEGSSYELTEETVASNVPGALDRADYDVLLVYDQSGAPSGELGTIGSNWASAVQSFAEAGGIVIVATGGAASSEMDDFITNLGLLTVSDFTNHNSERFYVQKPADALAVNVVSPFLSVNSSCTMTTSESPSGTTEFVIDDVEGDTLGSPGVVHKVVLPP